MRRRVGWVVLALVACADVPLDGVRFRCADDSECSSGQVCIAAVCAAPGAAIPDAGVMPTGSVRHFALADHFACFSRGVGLSCWGEIRSTRCADCQPLSTELLSFADGEVIDGMWGGREHVCWSSRGGATCMDRFGAQVPLAVSGRPRSIARPFGFACVVDTTGILSCVALGPAPPPLAPPQRADGYLQVVANTMEVCGLGADHRAACTPGSEANRRLDGLSEVVDLAANNHGVCAVTRDGQVTCSGTQPALPDLAYRAIDATADALCGVTDARVLCRGMWADGITSRGLELDEEIPIGAGAQLRVGASFACTLDDGELGCWGIAGRGELASTLVTSFAPFRADVPASRLIAAGTWRSCAVTRAGGLGCWGSDVSEPSVPELARPFVAVRLDNPPRAIASGRFESCAIREDGALDCFYGRRRRVDVGAFRALDVGDERVCAVNDVGEVWCGATAASTPLVRVATSTHGPAIDVALAGDASCALMSSGSVVCWGDNAPPFLRPGGPDYLDTPVTTVVAVGSSSITLGLTHGCVRGAGGTVSCWGFDPHGQLGRGENSTEVQPLAEVMGGPYVDVSGGIFHTCATRVDGRVDCFGQSFVARLGVVNGPSRNVPTLVPDVEGAVQVAVGGEHVCALLASGEVRCWGWSPTGALTGEYPRRRTRQLIAR